MNVTCGGAQELAIVESDQEGTRLIHGLGTTLIGSVAALNLHALAQRHQRLSPFGDG
jgi:hypothetical protein